MFKELKNQFMQVGLLTTIWVLVLLSIGFGNIKIELLYFWNIIGISLISATIFGVVYPFMWNFSTFSARANIIITTFVNFTGGFLAVFLFSTEMFDLVKPFWWAILIFTFILHIIAFYFYRNIENNKMIEELNSLNK